MSELEELREWEMEASRVLSNLYDAKDQSVYVEETDPLVFEFFYSLPDIKRLLETAPTIYRRLT